ncbi:serine protease [Fulvitalea axinellae]|uniref:Serine protease n=1 Tax=Fulvitalea axinellae TaxID=1182444 RepID=A0AAU9CRU6_9BACT|nr:serine protease [Fulvitalea axinellae]
MIKKALLLFFLLPMSVAVLGQRRYMVFFKDKHGSGYSLAEPSEFLSERAILRRDKQGIGLEERDLPVSAVYTDQLKNIGYQPEWKTKWLNGVLVRGSKEDSLQIATLPFVKSVEYVSPVFGSDLAKREAETQEDEPIPEVTQGQRGMMEAQKFAQRDFHGQGIMVAVFDGGFVGAETSLAFGHLWAEGKIKATRNYIEPSRSVFRYSSHGSEVLSCLAGQTTDGEFIGTAPGADVILCVTEDDRAYEYEHRIEEYNWLFAAEYADSLGVDIISSSLGYYEFEDRSMDYRPDDLGKGVAVISKAAKLAFERGMLVVTSAGNEGNGSWRYVTFPAGEPEVLAVGAIDDFWERASFSSIGYEGTPDRIKPDLVALGAGVQTFGKGDSPVAKNGTSYSAPLVAGFAACVWEKNPGWPASKLLEELRESGHRQATPDLELGYGVPQASYFLSDEDDEFVMSILSNPVTDGVITFRFTGGDPDTQFRYWLYDLSGRLVKDYGFQTLNPYGKLQLPLPKGTPKGIYLLRVESKFKKGTFRILVE